MQFSGSPAEVNHINWAVDHSYKSKALRELTASNFQDIFNLTRRTGEVEAKMNQIKFRAQGLGGMLGIAAGALGGPLGSTIGFGVGRSIGSFVGKALAKKYYGAEQASVNENLFLARQRDPQLKFQLGIFNSLGELIETMEKEGDKKDKKVLQDMLVI